MKDLQLIATYLIAKDITSSQSMAKWIGELRKAWEKDSDFLLSGRFHHTVRELHEMKLISAQVLTYLLQYSLWKDEAEKILQEQFDAGIVIFIIGDEDFPVEFADIYDPPAVLFCYGNRQLLAAKYRKVTLVGTREPSEYAVMKAKQLAYEAAKCRMIVVSGLANGIDSVVFSEAIARGGNTIAIVPQLQVEQMNEASAYKERILILSEVPICPKKVSKWQFIARNRLLAALSPYTIVIEAPIRSGTLITADLALTYGKSLYVVLPQPTEENSYGGIALAQSLGANVYIQSLYDAFYLEEDEELLSEYKEFIRQLSNNRIVIKDSDSRHLADVNLKRVIFDSIERKLDILSPTMVELHRFGIIRERKEKVVINFAGYDSWPKI